MDLRRELEVKQARSTINMRCVWGGDARVGRHLWAFFVCRAPLGLGAMREGSSRERATKQGASRARGH